MRYSPEIEAKIVAQIKAEPEREIILPDWAYRKGEDQPFVYVRGRQVRLSRWLYEKLIDPELPYEAGLKMLPTRNPRNINPHLFIVTPTRKTRVACPNGHEYSAEDMTTKGHRCRQCHEGKLSGIPNFADINAAKTHCPQGHPLAGDNLVQLKSGRRRCRTCHAETQARYRARKEAK